MLTKYIDKLAETYTRLLNEDPPKGYKTPLDKNDHPEFDTSEILEGDMTAKYLPMVGQLQWLVTFGRFDLHAEGHSYRGRMHGEYSPKWLLFC